MGSDPACKSNKREQGSDEKEKSDSNGDWVIVICDDLKRLSEIENVRDMESCSTVRICRVPESLSSGKPAEESLSSGKRAEAFAPMFVGLGPYHHHRATLTLTKDHKLEAANRVLLNLHLIPNQKEHCENYPLDKIIAMYPNPVLDSAYDLSGVLTVDGLFLLAFITLLTDTTTNNDQFSYFLNGNLSMPLLNHAGLELTKNALIREVFMLENQIPFHVLKILHRTCSALNNGDNVNESDHPHQDLSSMLKTFCADHCPLVNWLDLPQPQKPEDCGHLLDLMYRLVVDPPNTTNAQGPVAAENPGDAQEDSSTNAQGPVAAENPGNAQDSTPPRICSKLRSFLVKLPKDSLGPGCNCLCCFLVFCNIIAFLICSPVLFFLVIIWEITSALLYFLYRKVSFVMKILMVSFVRWKLLLTYLNPVFHGVHVSLKERNSQSTEPCVRIFEYCVRIFEYLDRVTGEEQGTKETEKDSHPSVMIPSVKELHDAGIKFELAKGGISRKTVYFDEKKCVFHLPCLKLDENSEVIIRNLVAYETLTKPYGLVFTKYIEMMRAIIAIPEDVRLLVDAKIIHSEVPKKVITDLFNGMSKSIRKNTQTEELDKVIHKVNAKFGFLKERKKAVRIYASSIGSISSLVILCLTALQTYCTVRQCSR